MKERFAAIVLVLGTIAAAAPTPSPKVTHADGKIFIRTHSVPTPVAPSAGSLPPAPRLRCVEVAPSPDTVSQICGIRIREVSWNDASGCAFTAQAEGAGDVSIRILWDPFAGVEALEAVEVEELKISATDLGTAGRHWNGKKRGGTRCSGVSFLQGGWSIRLSTGEVVDRTRTVPAPCSDEALLLLAREVAGRLPVPDK